MSDSSSVSFSDSIDRLKESFLWAAAQGGNTQDCESLIEIGADVNWKNTDGDTPLLAACRRGHTETIALLLAYGSNANVMGSDSLTPLHVCTRRGDAESVNILLNANINTSARTKEGQTALDIAQAKGYETIYARLMRKRSGISPKTSTVTIDGIRGSALGVTASTDDTARNPIRPHWVESKKKQTLSQVILSNIQYNGRADEEYSTDNNISNITINNNNNSGSSVNSTSQRLPSSSSTSSSSSSKKYTIMGTTINSNDASSGDETATIGLRKFLDNEQSARKAIELKLEIFKEQNSQLLHEYSLLSTQLVDVQDELTSTGNSLKRLQGEKSALDGIATIEQCEELERTLKHSLDLVEARKNILIRDKIELQKEQRLCVICQEADKSVVLLPCRHLCLCSSCSSHEDLKLCPLCREVIAHKISVFA